MKMNDNILILVHKKCIFFSSFIFVCSHITLGVNILKLQPQSVFFFGLEMQPLWSWMQVWLSSSMEELSSRLHCHPVIH